MVRTFAWLGRNRRVSKDSERQPESSEALIYISMSHWMLRHLEIKWSWLFAQPFCLVAVDDTRKKYRRTLHCFDLM